MSDGGRALSSNGSRTRHRRTDSTGSIQSYISWLSMDVGGGGGSVVSNIAQSSLFRGVDQGGRVQMHFPYEAVKLEIVDAEETPFQLGNVYLDGHIQDYEDFEEYHRVTSTDLPQWESLEAGSAAVSSSSGLRHPLKRNNVSPTQQQYNNLMGHEKFANISRPNYILAIKDDIYKRVVGEIADAQNMPCGCFFCGHHEDVAHPSILIAVVIVGLLFASMAYVAWAYDV